MNLYIPDDFGEADESSAWWNVLKVFTAVLFRRRCAACGVRDHLETHHNTRRGERGGEEAGDIIPLCCACHPLFEWLRRGASEFFKGFVWSTEKRLRRLRDGERKTTERLRATKEQVKECFEGTYRRDLDKRIAEAEQAGGQFSALVSELEFETAELILWQQRDGQKGIRKIGGNDRRAA